MPPIITIDNFILRLGLAMLLGMSIGFEREFNQKRAGLRTQTLVTIGAMAYVYISTMVIGGSVGDATRIAGQIASGVGFLGAGVIMREGLNIRGLNTAATLWCSSAVGCLTGIGMMIEATFFTFCIVVMNLLFKPLANMVSGNIEFEDSEVINKVFLRVSKDKELYIKGLIIQFIIDKDVELKEFKTVNSQYADFSDIYLHLSIVNKEKAQFVFNRIHNLMIPDLGVRELKWE